MCQKTMPVIHFLGSDHAVQHVEMLLMIVLIRQDENRLTELLIKAIQYHEISFQNAAQFLYGKHQAFPVRHLRG